MTRWASMIAVVVLCVGPAVADHDITVPYIAAPGSATVDGDLGDWAAADWIPLDEVYSGGPTDITSARYCLRWSDADNLLYFAVEVVDGDGDVDLDDFAVLKRCSLSGLGVEPCGVTSCPQGVPVSIVVPGDANLDRAVDLDDFMVFKAYGWAQVWPPVYDTDFDNDGDTDLDDFVILKGHFGMRYPEEMIELFWGWDFNFDGEADLDDIVVLKDVAYGDEVCGEWVGPGWTGATVPEPTSLSLLAVAALAAIRRRR